MFYPCSENKGTDQLRGNREADQRLCFRICKKPVFSRRGSFDDSSKSLRLNRLLCRRPSWSFLVTRLNLKVVYHFNVHFKLVKCNKVVFFASCLLWMRPPCRVGNTERKQPIKKTRPYNIQ